ncbi:winged helix-turn-helix domain-containing protein [Vagococcus sp. BWB3-3]|uniref:Winged helix-turn-helix domain-containing protein n=1 Tax=Vagococcus allomyrinae TaxID=2794353 RepID=A0A940SZC6_9ENTE|nr:winged helix-turn-helix domain-containing protein [Vagococcus allomyrinae]MBP1044293.1 winged helix-turn-helix domain-containing protein [Vagococcus allomyrinae]
MRNILYNFDCLRNVIGKNANREVRIIYRIGVVYLSEKDTSKWFSPNYLFDFVEVEYDNISNKVESIDGLLLSFEELSKNEFTRDYIQEIRSYTKIPIWTISKKSEISDRLFFLKQGIVANLTYSSNQDEIDLVLFNTMKQVLKQGYSSVSKKTTTQIFLDESRRLFIFQNKHVVKLTNLEFKFLSLLHENINSVLTYEQLSNELWNDSTKKTKIRISNVAFQLRQKFIQQNLPSELLQTIRSVGYMLNVS